MPEHDGESHPYDGPRYRAPEFYGNAAALQALAFVAAPLLAGAAAALIGVVVQQESSLRFPGTVLLLLTSALLSLVVAVQCGFWAARHYATPGDIEQWYRHSAPEKARERIEREIGRAHV